jgi:hypothetical protein
MGSAYSKESIHRRSIGGQPNKEKKSKIPKDPTSTPYVIDNIL